MGLRPWGPHRIRAPPKRGRGHPRTRPKRVTRKIPLGFFVTKSRSGYPRGGRAEEKNNGRTLKRHRISPHGGSASFGKRYFFSLVRRFWETSFRKNFWLIAVSGKQKYTYGNYLPPQGEPAQKRTFLTTTGGKYNRGGLFESFLSAQRGDTLENL